MMRCPRTDSLSRRLKGNRLLWEGTYISLSALLLLLLIGGNRTAKAASANYLGAQYCKRCHLVQYLAWMNTKMASSFDLLKPNARAEAKKKAGLDPAKDYTRDASCLKCHTTGYGRPGGFESAQKTPDRKGVQCEMCHGAGSRFVKVMKQKFSFAHAEVDNLGHIAPTRQGPNNVCITACHNPESPTYRPLYEGGKNGAPSPDYKEQLKKGVHRWFGLLYKHW